MCGLRRFVGVLSLKFGESCRLSISSIFSLKFRQLRQGGWLPSDCTEANVCQGQRELCGILVRRDAWRWA